MATRASPTPARPRWAGAGRAGSETNFAARLRGGDRFRGSERFLARQPRGARTCSILKGRPAALHQVVRCSPVCVSRYWRTVSSVTRNSGFPRSSTTIHGLAHIFPRSGHGVAALDFVWRQAEVIAPSLVLAQIESGVDGSLQRAAQRGRRRTASHSSVSLQLCARGRRVCGSCSSCS